MNLIPGEFRVLESSQMLLSKAFSNLFVATEMSPLLRTQNAGSKGQPPHQRESSKQTPLDLSTSGRSQSHMPGLHARSTLPRLRLTFTAGSETTAVPRWVSLCTKGTLRSADRKGLESLPGARAFFPFGVCLSLGHDFLPSASRGSATDEKQHSEVS